VELMTFDVTFFFGPGPLLAQKRGFSVKMGNFGD
jgi:hypothetical protein